MNKKQMIEYEKFEGYYKNLFFLMKNEKIYPKLIRKSKSGNIKHLRLYAIEDDFKVDITKCVKGVMKIFFDCKIRIDDYPIKIENQKDSFSYILDFLKTKSEGLKYEQEKNT